jgi:hypothetical protein
LKDTLIALEDITARDTGFQFNLFTTLFFFLFKILFLCSRVELPEETAKWARIRAADFPALHLPAPNPFIPLRLALLAQPVSGSAARESELRRPPDLIRKDDRWTVYHKLVWF